MKSSDFIINKLNNLHKNFNNIKIRYEFLKHLDTHLIEILPLEIYNSKNIYGNGNVD